MTATNKISRKEAGSAVVEFALVIPAIILFAFAGLEYSRLLRDMQIGSSLVQEVADVAFRDCSGERNDSSPTATFCLSLVHQRMVSQWSGLAAGSEVVISMYRFDGTISLEAQVGLGSQGSAYNAGKLSVPASSLGDIARSQEVVIIAEVYLPFGAPITFVPGISTTGGFLYDVSVI